VAGDTGALVNLLPVDLGRCGGRNLHGLPLDLRRGDIELADGFSPLGHTRTGAQQRVAILSDPVGDVAVMCHEHKAEQHQHSTDPKNDRNVLRKALVSH
jgi:hypothetical protein